MLGQVGRIIDIVGTVTILGLILRYSGEFSQVTAVLGSTVTGFYRSVALLDAPQSASQIRG